MEAKKLFKQPTIDSRILNYFENTWKLVNFQLKIIYVHKIPENIVLSMNLGEIYYFEFLGHFRAEYNSIKDLKIKSYRVEIIHWILPKKWLYFNSQTFIRSTSFFHFFSSENRAFLIFNPMLILKTQEHSLTLKKKL